jgi:hypothetical protein
MGSSCTVAAEALIQQVQNPVASFAQNNNGVVIQLPAATAAGPTLSGSLVLGIGTGSNNGVGSGKIFVPDRFGNLMTTFNGHQYPSFLDTGSNGYFFLDSKTTGLADCSTSQKGFYCPPSPVNLSAVNNSAQAGSSSTVNFTIVSASQLFSNSNDFVFPTLGGPNPGIFDWGLPFFMGRNVFVAIEGRNTPAGAGPFWAY